MSRPESTTQKFPLSRHEAPSPPPRMAVAAYTIPEFCEAHRISRTHFYELQRRGLGPDVAELLGKKIITHESAGKWRRQRTAASKKSA
jgi:hypothetical protein